MILVPAALLAGVALRVWQFQANPAMSLDEVAIARNVVDRSLAALLSEPLAYQQSAPKGFLLVEKLATIALGPTDWALRTVPFICSLGALVGFWRLTTWVLNPGGSAIAVTLFAFAAPLLRVNSQVKPYSADVAVAVLLLWLAVVGFTTVKSRRGVLGIGMVGALAVWFSQPDVFIVAAVCGVLVVQLLNGDRNDGPRARLVWPGAALWAVSAVAATLVSLASMTPSTHAYMQRFWQTGFLPLSWTQELEALWPWTPLLQFFGQGRPGLLVALGYVFPSVYVTVMIVGLVWLASRDWIGRTVALPVLVALSAAAVHRYPFSDRLLLFLLPTFCLGIAAFFQMVGNRLAWSSPFVAAVAVLVALTLYPVAHLPPPYQAENVKPILAYVQSHRLPGDGVYVYYGVAPAVDFYAAGYGLRAGDYAVGGCYRGQSRRYLAELDTYRGRSRVWVIVAHAIPRYAERADIVGYLDAIGVRKDQIIDWPRAMGQTLPTEAFLYDLSDAARLSATSAARFTIKGRASLDTRLGCTEGPQAMAVARPQSTPPTR